MCFLGLKININKMYLKLKRKENWNLSDMFLGLVRYF